MDEKLDFAESYIETGRYEKAVDFLSEIIDAEPNSKAYQLRGYAYYCLNEIDAAIPDLQYVVEHNKEADLANYYLAQIYSLMAEYSKAKECIERAVAIDRENFEYLGDYITIEQFLRNYQHSIELCNQILAETPESNFALNARGFALMALGNIDEAIVDFKKAVKENPYDFSVWNNLGIAYMKKGDDENAYTSFQTTLRLNPNSSDTYVSIGFLFYKKGDYEKALKYVDRAIELDVTNPNAFKNRALVYIALQETDKAKSDLLHAKELGYSSLYDNEVDELLESM